MATKEKKEKDRKENKKERKEKTEKKEKVNQKAQPLCEDKSLKTLYSAITLSKNSKELRIGINETIKKLNKGDADIVVLAGDARPFAIVEPVVHLCENKNRTFYFVESSRALGKACGLTRPVAACTLMYSENPGIRKLIGELRSLMSNA
ncbi:U4/U6 small nuclear ribonucleoprotein SNU13 [Nematocida sp. LUAm3]|nr:U4/U6 small nuclear ribonucleoprotein SNU13 [Nematocida sp. LUAm3]KAI5173783.1 U4/U6 small nuclear ribonucleoprotein SNU13 [Nematocida sp. LUAm2]KAI5177006.1 U4/U6 small nuclear ribonucleoprotein SNU13 [Nematocida sp. LUAm1]